MPGSLHSRDYRQLLARLRRARAAAGLTQAEAAKKLGKHQSYVSKCENGERRIDPVELKRFADLYGVDVRSLLSE